MTKSEFKKHLRASISTRVLAGWLSRNQPLRDMPGKGLFRDKG